MIREDVCRYTIDLCKNKSEEEIYQYLLNQGDKLSRGEKNTVFAYLCTKQLLDGELVRQIQERRKAELGSIKGELQISEIDVPLLVNAFRSMQYGRYMKHLIHSFIESKPDEIYLIKSNEEYSCGICGKPIYGADALGDRGMEWEAIASGQTDIVLCPDCLLQLKALDSILREIEGKYYMSWGTIMQR